jgi:hypothetical protein
MSQVVNRRFSVTASKTRKSDNEAWTLIVVYGAQSDTDKLAFIQEVWDIKQTASDRWLLLGDFNLIYQAYEKRSGCINRWMMNSFRQLLDNIEVKELHLHGLRYTWSSGTQSPT